MTREQKAQIDGMSYESLLELWRFSPVGNQLFVGDTGKYYSEVMAKKRNELEPGEAGEISKRIGLDKRTT